MATIEELERRLQDVCQQTSNIRAELARLKRTQPLPAQTYTYVPPQYGQTPPVPPQQAYRMPQAPNPQQNLAGQPTPPRTPPDESYRIYDPPKKTFTETFVGRYAISILAAILVLSAVAYGLGTVWDYIPNLVKCLAIIAAGIGIQYAAYAKLKTQDRRNGFLTALMATGMAIAFIGITAGAIIWGLYPTIVAGLLMVAWFAANFRLAYRLESLVFYVVTYIGGAMTVLLAAAITSFDFTVSNQISVGAAVAAIAAIGWFGYMKTGRSGLFVMEYLFVLLSVNVCMGLTIQHAVSNKMLNTEIGHLMGMPDPTPATVLQISQLLLAGILLFMSQCGLPKKLPWHDVIHSISALIGAAYLAMTASMLNAYAIDAYRLPMNAVALVLISVAILVNRDRPYPMLLGCTPVIAALLAIISYDVCRVNGLVPAVYAMVIVLTPAFRETQKRRMIPAATYAAALVAFSDAAWTQDAAQMIILAVTFLLLSATAILNYVELRKDDLPYRKTEQMLSIAVLAVAWTSLRPRMFGLNPMIGFAVISMLAIAHKIMTSKRNGENTYDDIISSFQYYVLSAGLCLAAYLGHPTDLGRALSTLILFAYSAAAVYDAISKRERTGSGDAIFAVLFANWNILWIPDIWHYGDAGLLVSAAGIAVSAMFIWIGFKFRFKQMRVTGLVLVIIYVLKTVLMDIGSMNGTGTNVAMLLFAGIVCFAISRAYNTLGKRYETGAEPRRKDADMLDTLYHVTLSRNVPGVMRQGLIPRLGDLARACHETVPSVWLFQSKEDLENAMTNWLGDEIESLYGDNVEISVLAVNLPAGFRNSLRSDAEYEIACDRPIPPEYISVVEEQ